MEFASSSVFFVGSLRVLQLPPTVQRYAVSGIMFTLLFKFAQKCDLIPVSDGDISKVCPASCTILAGIGFKDKKEYAKFLMLTILSMNTLQAFCLPVWFFKCSKRRNIDKNRNNTF